jgi:two-component sensor histidine kinase
MPIRVLYIDDDAGLRRLVQRGLEREGFVVETAADGDSGLDRLGRGDIDVVALDQIMPGMDGLETLAAMQAAFKPPPVVFVTGSQDSRIAVAALKAGASDYVIKDVHGEFLPLLRAAVESAYANARLRGAKEAAEAEVRAARDRFEALATEREILLREVNHRVGNSLQLIASMLQIQAGSAPGDDTRTALLSAVSRVMAVAQVHKRLYTSDDVKSVSLDQYLEALVEDLRRSTTGDEFAHLTLQADPLALDPDRAVAVGVIVTELVMNAVKYAYPNARGPIRVRLRAVAPSSAELVVEDDGVGTAAKPLDSLSSGLGQRIVKAMAVKLDAQLALDPSHRGTSIAVTFDTVPPAVAA